MSHKVLFNQYTCEVKTNMCSWPTVCFSSFFTKLWWQYTVICKSFWSDLIFNYFFYKTDFLAFIPNYVSLFHQKHNTTQFEKWWHLRVCLFFVCLFVVFVAVCRFVCFCVLLYCCLFSHMLSKMSSFIPYILLEPKLDDAMKTWN